MVHMITPVFLSQDEVGGKNVWLFTSQRDVCCFSNAPMIFEWIYNKGASITINNSHDRVVEPALHIARIPYVSGIHSSGVSSWG